MGQFLKAFPYSSCSSFPVLVEPVTPDWAPCPALQLFIFFSIRRFGSLTNTIITTTRKFFNILLSVLWLGNPLLPQQWAAVAMVFSGLFVASVVKPHGGHKKQS